MEENQSTSPDNDEVEEKEKMMLVCDGESLCSLRSGHAQCIEKEHKLEADPMNN